MAKVKGGRLQRREAITGYLYILPLFIGLGVFFLYAFGANFYYSFTNKSSFGVPKFIGLRNYRKLFEDPEFFQALGHTFAYVAICVPIIVCTALVLAALLNSKIKGRSIYRTLIILPIVTMPVAVALLWKWIFNYEFGIVNTALNALGYPPVAWMSDKNVSLFTVCIVVIWCSIGQPLVIFLGGLQGINRSYYEAATIDGASPVQQFFRITLPLLSPTTFMILITQIIGFFQMFDLIYMMIPIESTGMDGARSIVMMFYEEAFVKNNKGYGAAVSMVLFVIILFFTIIQVRMQNKWVNYD